jgi:hypothetical protein
LTAATIFLLMNEVSATSLTVNVAGDANYTMGGTFSGTSGDLRGVLNNINLTPDTYQVTFALTNPTITPLAALPVINLNTGNMVGIDGSNGGNQIVLNCSTTPGFFAAQGTVSIENMTIENCLAHRQPPFY